MAHHHEIATSPTANNYAADAEAQLSLEKGDSLTDLLQAVHGETPKSHQSAENRRSDVARRQKMASGMSTSSIPENDEENLGENFEATPWLPPSIEKAEEYRKKSIYRGGDARIDSVNLVHAADLGTGVSLYFQFALTMAVCLFIMSLFSLPALIFCYSGQGVAVVDRDSFGLYKYMVGNIGYAVTVARQDTLCSATSGYSANTTCLHLNDSLEVSVGQAASVITAMEFLQVFVFFIGVLYLYRTALSVTGRNSKSETSISDYSILVTNLPPDTTDADLLEHFSSLYRLDDRDFKRRPGLEGAQPVRDCSHCNDPQTLGSWVAEVALHKAIGGFVFSFKSKEHIMRKMYRCRAKMKMFAENSPHHEAGNMIQYAKAESAMIQTGTAIDRLTDQNLKRADIRILAPGVSGRRAVSKPSSIYYNIDAAPVAAFVVFEYCESMARCVRDYQRVQQFPFNLPLPWLYPSPLLFKGHHKIEVRQAPEPDQIVWEHLEVPKWKQSYLRARTIVITILLVVGCFVILLQAAINKAYYSAKIPDDSLCRATIPTLYLNDSSVYRASSLSIVRPSSISTALALDSSCQQGTGRSDAFYGVYSPDGSYDSLLPGYDFSACYSDGSADFTSPSGAWSVGGGGLCPRPSASSFCPCLSTDSASTCRSSTCFSSTYTGNDELSGCESFKAGDIGSCYCYSLLNNLLQAGVIAALSKLSSLGDGKCSTFLSNYSLSTGINYAAIVCTTIVNALLRQFLKKLAKQEARASTDEEQGSVMSKIFVSNYATMAVIALLAYGKSDYTPTFLKQLRIFDGSYMDFSPAWYGSVGFYLLTTFIVQSFSPLLFNLGMYFVGLPALRWRHHKQVRNLTSRKIVCQDDLNRLQVGPVFDSTDHTAQLLTLLFFAMSYSPGLPLLMPLCCFAFCLYFRVDKLLLCRYYKTPPHIGDRGIRLVVKLLPLAAVIRLAFAIWMLGNKSIFTEEGPSSSSYRDFLLKAREEKGYGIPSANDRLLLPHTFPLFILLLFISAAILIVSLWRQLPIYWIWQVVKGLSLLCGAAGEALSGHRDDYVSGWELLKLNDPLRQQSSPYTGDFFRYLKHKDEIPSTFYDMLAYGSLTKITTLEREEGWQAEDRGPFVVKVKAYLTDDERRLDGTRSMTGDKKRTCEVVADHRCYSFDIEKVPAYSTAVQGLREGTAGLLETLQSNDNENDNNDGKNRKNKKDPLLFDAADLAISVLAQYEKKKPKGQDNDNKPRQDEADEELGQMMMNQNNTSKPQAPPVSASRPRSAAIAVTNNSRPTTANNDNHKAVNKQPTRKRGAAHSHTSPNAGGNSNEGNFTFDDFMASSEGQHQLGTQEDDNTNTLAMALGTPSIASPRSAAAANGHGSHGHHSHSKATSNNGKIHISHGHKKKVKGAAKAGSQYAENDHEEEDG